MIANIRARVEQCRRLADLITNREAAAILRQMADDGERDVRRLEAKRRDRDQREA